MKIMLLINVKCSMISNGLTVIFIFWWSTDTLKFEECFTKRPTKLNHYLFNDVLFYVLNDDEPWLFDIHPAFVDYWLISVLSRWQWLVLCLHVAPLDPLPETWLSLTHARMQTRTYIPSFLFLALVCAYTIVVNVQYTRTFCHDNDDSQGDDQFSFLSNLAFCRPWLPLLSVSLLKSRDVFLSSVPMFCLKYPLLISVPVCDYWTFLYLPRPFTRLLIWFPVCYFFLYLFTWPIRFDRRNNEHVYDLVLLILFKFNHHQVDWAAEHTNVLSYRNYFSSLKLNNTT